MQAKPVQIAVIVIGLLIGAVGIFLAVSKNSGPDLADKMIFADVKTGDLYAVSIKGRSVTIPYRHPETNERTLLPATFNEDNEQWELKSRYLGALDGIDGLHSSVDARSGKLTIDADAKPKTID